MSNPLLESWTLPFGVIPYGRFRTEHFLPAAQTELAAAQKRLAQIRDSVEAPSFENTIVALETVSEGLDRVLEVYFNLLSAEADEAHHALAKDLSPLSAGFSNDVLLDAKIFARVKAVYDQRASLKLDVESARLLDKTYRSFVRNGANLDAAAKERVRAIDDELSKLTPQYAENLLKDSNAYQLWIEKQSDLDGLPESSVEAAAAAAAEKGRHGVWLFTLDYPSYIPFLTYSKNRKLRETMYRAANARAFGGEHDNRSVLKSIARLRHDRAKVLGFKTHADYVLSERMAETPARVTSFLDRIFAVAKPAAEKEVAEVRAYAKQKDGLDDFQGWDFAHYSEKLKEERYRFSDEDLRPYFKLESVIEGAFAHAARLFGLQFKELQGIPVYHPDVKVFEVMDPSRKDLPHVGLLYADFFPRPTKKSGAWMTPLQEQGLRGGKVMRPHISIVCNFTKPTPTKPSLLTLQEVKTLFHEFGHALHGLLSECRYRSLAGTNVYWDFVELPSQLLENWVAERETLDTFAKHFETGALIPEDLSKKLKTSEQYLAAYQAMRQVSFASLDMAWHAADPSGVDDVEAFEKSVMDRTRLLPAVKGANMSCSFSHIFSGGYSAGYYSYKWAEVLDADAFEFFKEKGLYSRDVADKLRANILSRGGTEPPMELYKKFRGREPDPDALLRRDGLL